MRTAEAFASRASHKKRSVILFLIDLMPMSRDSLIGQLVFEGFTQDQAEHGASAVGY